MFVSRKRFNELEKKLDRQITRLFEDNVNLSQANVALSEKIEELINAFNARGTRIRDLERKERIRAAEILQLAERIAKVEESKDELESRLEKLQSDHVNLSQANIGEDLIEALEAAKVMKLLGRTGQLEEKTKLLEGIVSANGSALVDFANYY